MNQLKSFREFLQLKGLRVTPEREAVFEEALNSGDHFEAEDLLFRLKSKDERISKATIYRTLPLLIEGGWLRKVIFNERHTHYERSSGARNHEHLVCADCGKIIEFKDKLIQEHLDAICRRNSFEPQDHKVEVTGYCKNCRK
jgi:Fur family ferric uptake transcriptional regulator